MRTNSRFHVTTAIAVSLITLGMVALEHLLISGGVLLMGWTLAHQTLFVRNTQDLKDFDISIGGRRNQITTDESLAVTLYATLAAPSPLNITVTPDLSPNVYSSGRHQSLRFPAGTSTANKTFEVKSPTPGTIDIGPQKLAIQDPACLFTSELSYDETATVKVQPRTSGNLHIGAGDNPRTALYGEHKSGKTGAGIEPYEIREYAPGDQLSQIDWKATARLGKPHVRKYELTTTHETAVIIDHRASMAIGPKGETKLDYLREAALSFVTIAERFEDPVGLYTAGDKGTTTVREPGAGTEQYNAIHDAIQMLTPTTVESSVSKKDPTTPSQVRTNAARLDTDSTPLGETLWPYFDASDVYVRRLAEQPLFRTVQRARSDFQSGSWAVILTDDSNPTEVREAAKLARRNDWQVQIFIAPSVLYEPDGLDNMAHAYDRYREFEKFRKSLAQLDRVAVFQVAPGDRLESVLSQHRPKDWSTPNRATRNRRSDRKKRNQSDSEFKSLNVSNVEGFTNE